MKTHKETIGNATLYLGDCMDVMSKMSENDFDLAIVDPPYGIGKTWMKSRKGQKNFKTKYKNETPPGEEYFKQLFHICNNWIIWGANFYPYVWPNKNVIIWDKDCTWEKEHKAEAEIAVTNLNHRPVSVFKHTWSGGRKGKETGIKIIHPHQKHLGLYRWLLEKYAKPCDLIFDTHLGSGSIVIACMHLGFKITAVEIDKANFDAACRRIEKVEKQGNLFVPKKPELKQLNII